jgi:hypothetical protein
VGCGLHKEEKWRGLCTSLPFFFLEIEQEGEGNGRRGGTARPWAPAPWCMTTPGEDGKTERRPRGSDSGPHLVRRWSTEGCPRRWVVGGNGERRWRAAARGRGGEVLGRYGWSQGWLGG